MIVTLILRYEWRLCSPLGCLQGVPRPHADAHLLWFQPSEARQLRLLPPSPGLHLRQPGRCEAALRQEHGGAGAQGQEQEDTPGPGSQARAPGHHQVSRDREEEKKHLPASVP